MVWVRRRGTEGHHGVDRAGWQKEAGERSPATVLAPGSAGQPGPSPRLHCNTMTYIHPCCWWMRSQTFKEFVPLGLAGRSQGRFLGPGLAHCWPQKGFLSVHFFCGVNNELYI